jgi:hypothetical protein
MSMTRRQLLARAGAAGAAAATAGAVLPRWLRSGSEAPAGRVAPFAASVPTLPVDMGPRRCVALGPAGCIAPGSPQDLRAAGNRAMLADSGTRWVRLWADWPSLMPAPGAFGGPCVDGLDQQIAQARADGIRTILTIYRTPGWARRAVSSSRPWEQFVGWLVGRYGDAVDVLELCNEPNLRGTRPETVAAMFASAQRIAGGLGSPVVLAGPALADARGYDAYADRLLAALDANGFVPGAKFAWTHHNYADVAYGTSRAADMRRRLVGRWAGWPDGDAGNPQLLVTEGGVTLPTIARRYRLADPQAQRAKQAELLTDAWRRLTTGGEGEGIAMVTQYLFYTDPNYDSGLCEATDAGGGPRPAYAAWKALPSLA